MAGPGFDFIYTKDPKQAAKNVQCIHTSAYAGTLERNCHQDWLMGHCGRYLYARDDVEALLCEIFGRCNPEPNQSHSMCPVLYNSAFKNNFVFNNRHLCRSRRMVQNLPADFKMGYMETRRR